MSAICHWCFRKLFACLFRYRQINCKQVCPFSSLICICKSIRFLPGKKRQNRPTNMQLHTNRIFSSSDAIQKKLFNSSTIGLDISTSKNCLWLQIILLTVTLLLLSNVYSYSVDSTNCNLFWKTKNYPMIYFSNNNPLKKSY